MSSLKEIYIILTRYQLLITLLKLKKEENNVLILLDDILKPDKAEEMISSGLVQEIIRLNDYDFTITRDFCSTGDIRKKTLKLLKNAKNIYIYVDHFYLGCYMDKHKIEYNTIEDGYNYYKYSHENFIDRVFTKNAKSRDYIEFIKHLLFARLNKPGFGKYCKSIEVNDISVVPRDERWNKFFEVPRYKLFKNINEKRKLQILNLFEVEELKDVSSNSVLILTQPLSIDKLISSQEAQYNFYKKICRKCLEDGYEVYLKPHPRDTINYGTIEGINVIAKDVPMELIEMVSDAKFKKIIAHSSTAIDFLSCGEEKEIIFDFTTRKYNSSLLSKYNVAKEEL